jgi:hypothetical protein
VTNFAILRVEKVKTMGSLAARGRHNFREQDTPNAEAGRSCLNVHEGSQSTDELLKAVSDLLPAKRRKDAVIGLEYLITASPEHFGADWMDTKNHGDAYFRDAIAWLEAKHGKENVVCKTIHLDESTPHLAAFVVPLVNGKLNAKAFTGGAKALAEMQTSFAAQVGAKHRLERGIERSKAVHQDNAKIKPMTIERLALRKQVKALSDEVERLTKKVADGGVALAAAQAELAKVKARFESQHKLNISNFHLINELQAENKALKLAKQAVEVSEEESVAPRTSNDLTAALAAFDAKWKDAQPAKKTDLAAGKLVEVCGNRGVYSMGRGRHVIHTFAPNEPIPKLAEKEKAGISR